MGNSLAKLDLKIVGGKYGTVDIRASEDGRSAILLENGVKWTTLNLDTMTSVNELYSSLDLAYGDVLITGLGFGVMLRLLEQKDSVKSITVLEFSQGVIDAFLQNNKLSSKTKIIHANASDYKDDKKYDGVFLDHYEDQEYFWKVNDINTVSKNIKHDAFWAWSLEGIFYAWLMGTGRAPNSRAVRPTVTELAPGFEKYWPEYIKIHFPEEDYLLKMDLKKVEKYVNMFFTIKR